MCFRKTICDACFEGIEKMSTVLKVERSVLDARWVLSEANNDTIQRMMVDFSMPEIIARLLVARNVQPEQVDSFLYPRLKRDFPDHYSY